MEPKIGYFVTLVAKDKNHAYYNGTYLVTALGPGNKSFVAVKPAAGYNGHDSKTFELLDYDIVDVFEDDAFFERYITDLEHFAGAPKRGEKLQWVEYVYTNAAATAVLARRAFQLKKSNGNSTVPTITVTVEGPCKSGKSTVAKAIVEGLRGKPFSVSVRDGNEGSGYVRPNDVTRVHIEVKNAG